LVQSNFGGVLQVMGAPVGQELGRYAFRAQVEAERGDGSIIIVVATDAPVSHRNLQRIASRAMLGLGRTGSSASNGSGDYVVAFSTAATLRRGPGEAAAGPELGNDALSPVFQAVVEATEEAIYTSLFLATTVSSRSGTVEAIPLDRFREVLRKYGIGWGQ
jgi:D-aminopeptidase